MHIMQRNQNQIMFCTDEAKNQHLTTAAVNLTLFAKEDEDYFIIKQQLKHSLTHEYMQYEKKTINFSWKLNVECSILQAELFAILQAIKLINHLIQINDLIDFTNIYSFRLSISIESNTKQNN